MNVIIYAKILSKVGVKKSYWWLLTKNYPLLWAAVSICTYSWTITRKLQDTIGSPPPSYLQESYLIFMRLVVASILLQIINIYILFVRIKNYSSLWRYYFYQYQWLILCLKTSIVLINTLNEDKYNPRPFICWKWLNARELTCMYTNTNLVKWNTNSTIWEWTLKGSGEGVSIKVMTFTMHQHVLFPRTCRC